MLTATITALIYTRVSTDEQAAEGYSLDAQLSEARRYAARQQWIIGAEFQDVLSGKRDDRPAVSGAPGGGASPAGRGQPVAVVVAALDRFGRSILERIRSRDELKRLGVPTHSVREGGEVSDLVANILASVAQEEAGGWASGCWRHATTWRLAVGSPPAGHLGDIAGGRRLTMSDGQGSPASVLQLDPITEPYVGEAFKRAATTRACRRCAVGCLPPAAARGERNLRYCAIRDVLSAAVYVGRTEDRTEPDVLARSRGRWPVLVDDATLAVVQAPNSRA